MKKGKLKKGKEESKNVKLEKGERETDKLEVGTWGRGGGDNEGKRVLKGISVNGEKEISDNWKMGRGISSYDRQRSDPLDIAFICPLDINLYLYIDFLYEYNT